jgi:hypothetical protein
MMKESADSNLLHTKKPNIPFTAGGEIDQMPGGGGYLKESVFQCSQEYLFSLLTIIYTTTGTPPRAFQLVDFCYATSGMITRDFWLIDKMHGVFGCQHN